MRWVWKNFKELTTDELYDIIQARERVFAVEQNIVYLDCDGQDRKAWHLYCASPEGRLLAYLRAFPPGVKYAEASFGRVLSTPEGRGQGLGRELTRRGLEHIEREFGKGPVRISAQAYLEKFYGDFGFVREGDVYVEEDVPHIQMRKP